MWNMFSKIGDANRENSSIVRLRLAVVAGFLSVILLVMWSLMLSYQNLSSMDKIVGEIVEENNKKTMLIYKLNNIVRERLILLYQMSNESDWFVLNESIQQYYSLGEKFILSRQALDDLSVTGQEKQLMKQLKSILVEINPTQNKIMGAISEEDSQSAISMIAEMNALQIELVKVLSKYSNYQGNLNNNLNVNIKNIFDNSLQWLLIMSALIISIGTSVAFFVVRFVTGQQESLVGLNVTLESYNAVLELTTDAAERSNRSKSEFIANMSHELRTPMTAIKGSLGILNSGMVENIPDDAKNLIQMADKNTDRLIGMITDVLDFSKIESGEIDVIKENFSIQSELEKFIIPFYQKANSKSIFFKVTYSDNLPSTVQIDRIHLVQILTQLLNNAIKFTPNGGVTLDINFDEAGGNIIFHVIDTGIGLLEEDIHFLFEPFVQGDGSSTRKYGGTGIGLAICRKLIDALEGEIRVMSVKEKGSTFTLSVPTSNEDLAA